MKLYGTVPKNGAMRRVGKLISRRSVLGSAGLMVSASGLANLTSPASGQSNAQSSGRGAAYFGLPDAHEIWEEMLYLISLGSRNTGFPGHVKFVNRMADWLATAPGVSVLRDTYTLPRWEEVSRSLQVRRPGGKAVALHSTSAYPYSGKTSAKGVTGKIVDLGSTQSNGMANSRPLVFPDVRGKIVFLRSPVHGFPAGDSFKAWGAYPDDLKLPDLLKTELYQTRSAPALEQFKEAGAAGVILSWVGVSDANAEGQYVPFGRKFADCPALWVGETTGEEIAKVAAAGGEATIALEANIFPNTPTDTLYGILPGQTDEVILVHTHSDGPNAVEENGPIGVVALAKFLAAQPKGSLRRTYVFTMTTGHMAGAYVPSVRGFIQKHADIIKRTVGALVIEHLGSREWVDRGQAYVPSGYNQTTMLQTQSSALAKIALEESRGTLEDRVVAVNPYKGRYTGESGATMSAGIPTIGFMPAPSFLLKESENCGIEKQDPRLLRAQLENFSRMLLRMDGMSKADLAG
ncbi:hypothetical protein [Novosphingobium sp. PP1Y]|uniref:hypothetical protein n=1 Tax=Novosphingobium sp. PP1Y TaxID=702113 RepID=UPI0011D2AFB2|nr:hypothetical protein [Novosphingobium sp. PP1Y]